MPEPFGHNIKQKTFIDAPPERVYDTVASASGWNSFFTSGMELDPKPGGRMVWRWENYGPNFYTTEVQAKVLEADRPHRFAFEWGTKMPSKVEFDLKAKYGGTVISLTESGYLDTAEGRENILECASGWGEALTLLKFYIEHGILYSQPKRND